MENSVFSVKLSFADDENLIRIVICDGYLNLETYKIFTAAIHRLLESRFYSIVVDLSGTGYISSSGWGAFLGSIETVRAAGGDIRLAAMRPEVEFVFDALELDNVLKNFPTVQEAVSSFTTGFRGSKIFKT
jgi:anti-sigma B factor antagonist